METDGFETRRVVDVAANSVRFTTVNAQSLREADAIFKTTTSSGPCKGCAGKSAPIDGLCWACATEGCLIKQ